MDYRGITLRSTTRWLCSGLGPSWVLHAVLRATWASDKASSSASSGQSFGVVEPCYLGYALCHHYLVFCVLDGEFLVRI